ncbi:MAG TPA: LAGLIDADG family homing endonuclease [Candidatus Paceibacterota bacterium]|nr:LAGLIDADG family homing endonuclease [Candidatus Paceibacterota bacterium]
MLALNKKRNIHEYISGYIDGEGCFSVSFSKREKFLVGIETKPSFSVSQNEDRSQILFLIKKEFGCGFIRRDFSDKTLKYEIRSLEELINKVIPHFEKYPLLSSKQEDFKLFSKICFMMQRNLHRNKKGLEKIISIAFRMNPGGKRKYTKEEILKTLR